MDTAKTQIVPTRKLKVSYLKSFAKEKKPIYILYESRFDALMIIFVSPDHETVVHHIDDYFSVLFIPTTKEIVGFQIEDFKHSFLPKHQGVKKVWEVHEDMKFEYFDEVYLWYEKMKPKIVQEILKASENKLAEQGLPLKSFSKSFSSEILEKSCT